MEYIVNAKVKNDVFAVLCSVVLGAAAGYVVNIKVCCDPLVAGTGAVVGLLLGLLLRRMYKAANVGRSTPPIVKKKGPA